MFADLVLVGEKDIGPTRSGALPYLAVAGGLLSMAAGYVIFWV
jgi:hypothetical protein